MHNVSLKNVKCIKKIHAYHIILVKRAKQEIFSSCLTLLLKV